MIYLCNGTGPVTSYDASVSLSMKSHDAANDLSHATCTPDTGRLLKEPEPIGTRHHEVAP